MKTFAAIILVCCLSIFGVVGCSIGTIISVLNTEAVMKNGIKASEDDREQAYDKLYKKLSQSVQITKASSTLQKELVQELIKGRPAGFIRAVNESNPEIAFDRKQYDRLENLMEGERDSFYRNQKVLISKVEQYNNQFDSVIAGNILMAFGRQKYPNPVIITSDNAKEVRETGKDNNTDLGLE